MNKLYEEVQLDGMKHKVATLRYNEGQLIYMIASFPSRQLADCFLACIQKGTNLMYDGNYIFTKKNGYVAKFAKATDENNSDGVHAIIHTTDTNVIEVFEGETITDKIYNWLDENTQCGILPEWKGYFYIKLCSHNMVDECEGFDITGKAPRILIMSDKITNELLRDIKSLGLKCRDIKLPVKNTKEIDKEMSFVDIIEKLIIPYIEDQDCLYNVGDKISPILNKPICIEGKNIELYPKQKIMAMGLINYYKKHINNPKAYTILNGGCSTGKTLVSVRTTQALMEEVLKCNNKGKIGLICQSHLINKWRREILGCFTPLGIKPKFYLINKFSDIDKIPKKSKGIDVLIFPKDRVKRTWLYEHSMVKKFPHRDNAIKKFAEATSSAETYLNCVLQEVNDLTAMKYIGICTERRFGKKSVMYKPYINDEGVKEGYYIATTSKAIRNRIGDIKKSYNNIFEGSFQDLKDLIRELEEDIGKESISKISQLIENPMVCPTCGSKMYVNAEDIFDEENKCKYINVKSSKLKSGLLYCNALIKADGTPLTDYEINLIRNNKMDYKMVKKKSISAYINEDGEPITGKELIEIKKDPRGSTVLLYKCKQKLFGSKNQKGYRCFSSTKYMLKRFGKKSIDVCIGDEVHLLSSEGSLQGQAFGDLCRLSKITLNLSGSLTSGRASDLFYLLFRLSPRAMIEMGYGYKDKSLFVSHYGRKKQEIVNYEPTYNKSGYKTVKQFKEIPGISPVLYAKMLVNNMVSRKIEDMDVPLPPKEFYKHEIEMSSELKNEYYQLKSQFTDFFIKHKGVSLGGSYINTLLSYLDYTEQKDVYVNIEGESILVATPKAIKLGDELLPKEQKLVDTIKKELKEDRRCLVYATFTGTRGVSKRLMEVLSRYFKVALLEGSKVKLEKREEWIKKKYEEGYQVLLTNPECVSTGLDIIQYPTIYFYEIPTNTKTLLQSESRAYRFTNKRKCKIYYSYYADSIQKDLLILQLSKKRSSLALEGVMSNDILSTLAEGGDTIESMLNDVLQGKIKLKESELDGFNFEEESSQENIINVEYSEVSEKGNELIELKESAIEELKGQKLSLFTVDDEFKSKLKGKSKKTTIDGQLGFAI